MRLWCCLMLAAIAAPAYADPSPPYYGPMKAWRGIGFKFGFRDDVEKDGLWRVDAAVRSGEALDMAMYRVAERAREQGYAFVQFQGGTGRRSPGTESATLYARPSHSSAPPATCRSKKRTACYTADVAEVLRILGGPGGTQPGVPITDHMDEYGRAVRYSGYGLGAASLTPTRLAPVPVPTPMAVGVPAAVRARIAAAAIPRAAQPSRPAPKRGWSISD